LTRRLHAIGPLPPPQGGGTLNFEIFTEDVRARSAELGVSSLHVTNTSPTDLRTTHDLTLAVVARQARLLGALAISGLRREHVVLFCSERQFVASAPLLLALRAAGLPVVIKFVGYHLTDFLRALPPGARGATGAALRRMTAILCQTELMLNEVRAMGVDNARLSPGYRRIDWARLPALPEAPRHPGELRLVYLGLVSESKGVHDVLRALARLDRPDISLDLHGQVPPAESARFAEVLRQAPRAIHKGVFTGDPVALLAEYDAFVFPSFHSGEGHPGVVIEAMAAGIPVVVSRFRSLPELVTDGVNGLVVEPRDVDGLARALVALRDRPEVRLRLGRAHRSRLAAHDSRRATELILGALGGGQM
jgi:glycosyltransferase involved in cell wall biosynthesis